METKTRVTIKYFEINTQWQRTLSNVILWTKYSEYLFGICHCVGTGGKKSLQEAYNTYLIRQFICVQLPDSLFQEITKINVLALAKPYSGEYNKL